MAYVIVSNIKEWKGLMTFPVLSWLDFFFVISIIIDLNIF